MYLRWFEPTQNVAIEFEASNLASFTDKALDALIDFRIKTRILDGQHWLYPAAQLELQLPNGRWSQAKLSSDLAAMRAPRRSDIMHLVEGEPTDSEIVKQFAGEWWEVCTRIINSVNYRLAQQANAL
jgi:hypothetical protein